MSDSLGTGCQSNAELAEEFKQLLARLETAPKDVAVWSSAGFSGAPPLRARIVADALLPAAVTESWEKRAGESIARGEHAIEQAWRDVARIDCATEQEEAGVIAHMQAICNAVGIGVIYYARDNSRLSPAGLEKLAETCPKCDFHFPVMPPTPSSFAVFKDIPKLSE